MADEIKRPTGRIIEQKTVYDEFFKLLKVTFERWDADGRRIGKGSETHLVLERGDSVAVLPIVKSDDAAVPDHVVLVEQFRVATALKERIDEQDLGGWLVEAVAGMPKAADNKETMIESFRETAKRELEEETNLAAELENFEYVGWFWSSPGGISERILVYLCDAKNDVEDGKIFGDPEEDEYVIVRKLSVKEFLIRAYKGELTDPKMAFAALSLAQRYPTEVQIALEEARKKYDRQATRRQIAFRHPGRGPQGDAT